MNNNHQEKAMQQPQDDKWIDGILDEVASTTKELGGLNGSAKGQPEAAVPVEVSKARTVLIEFWQAEVTHLEAQIGRLLSIGHKAIASKLAGRLAEARVCLTDATNLPS